MPNRVGSSLVNISNSIGRTGANPIRFNARIASSPPRTPTVPSNRPECGIASMCEPVADRRQVGLEALPACEDIADGSSRTASPASAQSLLIRARRRQVRVGVEHARDRGRGRIAMLASSSSSAIDPVDVHLDVWVGHASFLHRVAVHVLVVEVAGRPFAHRHEPLRAVGRHPDDVTLTHRIPVVAQAIDPLALEHEQAVLHHVHLDHRQGRPGLVGEDVDGKVEARIGRQEHFEDRVRVAQEGAAGDVSLVAPEWPGDEMPGRLTYRFSNTLRRQGVTAHSPMAVSGGTYANPPTPRTHSPSRGSIKARSPSRT